MEDEKGRNKKAPTRSRGRRRPKRGYQNKTVIAARKRCATQKPPPKSKGRIALLPRLLHCDRFGLDHHKLAHRSLVDELDASGDLGEERVVLAASYVQSGLHARAALADDDRSAGHQLPAESFKAKPLRVRVASVS